MQFACGSYWIQIIKLFHKIPIYVLVVINITQTNDSINHIYRQCLNKYPSVKD